MGSRAHRSRRGGTNQWRTRPAAVGLLTAGLVATLTLPSGAVPAGGAGTPVRRLVTTAGNTLVTQALPLAVVGRRTPPAGSEGISVRTVDTATWTGYENAVYAADSSTVFVAYKRFLQDPRQQYTQAELRVARSTDGGRTWDITVVDPNAIEDSQTLDQTVSIDGDHGSTIYVAYHTRSSGLFASMKLRVAKSTNGGDTWSLSDVAASNAGDYNAVRVLDADRVVIAAHGAGGGLEGLHVYTTATGGSQWTDTNVEPGIGLGIYNGVGATRLNHWIADDYDSLSGNTNLHGTRYAARRDLWNTKTIDGDPGVGLTGLGASLTMPTRTRAYAAYEQDLSGAFVKVATTTDGGRTWTPVVVESNPTIGWNTAVKTFGAMNVFTSYWWYAQPMGQAHVGVSHDGGLTWDVLIIPEARHVQPYIDLSATKGREYVSYQSTETDGTSPKLRLAVIGG
jgi:hypothetical protein